MTTLVVGANGATGRLLVEQLLCRGQHVRAIVRSREKFSEAINADAGGNLSVIQASLLDLSDVEMAHHLDGCNAVASCLGHNLSLKGIYGHPRWLVTDATRRLCTAIRANKPKQPTKFLLMNTAGNSNRDLNEPLSLGQRSVIGLLRLLLPPHLDNERAADYLRTKVGQEDEMITWTAVRPDNLIDADSETEYEVYSSPIRSAIFDPGQTSRINVGSFMADLITDDAVWSKWKGQMPVIYNTDTAE